MSATHSYGVSSSGGKIASELGEKPLWKMEKSELAAKAVELGIPAHMKGAAELKRDIEGELLIRKREKTKCDNDPFMRMLKETENEHVRQMAALRQENAALKQRLDTMVASTWNLQSNSKGMHGTCEGFGDVALVCKTPGQELWSTPRSKIQPDDEEEDDRPEGLRVFTLQTVFGSLEEALTASTARQSERRGSIDSEFSLASGRWQSTVGNADVSRWQCMMSPTSPKRVTWELIGMLLLAYDFVMIPISIFNPSSSAFVSLMEWITLVYWTADMFSQFCTGYVSKGVSVMNFNKIWRNYLTHWFIFDLLIVGPDWTFTIIRMVAEGDNNTSSVKLLRSFRITRLLRLLRAAKMKKLLQRATDQIETEAVFLVFSIGRVLTFVVLFNHLAAAVWYFVGDAYTGESDSGTDTWIETYDMRMRPVLYRYITAYGWSIANFGFSDSAVYPQNSLEGLLSIILLITGMLTLALFISMVTTWMVQLSNSQEDTSKQLWLLRRFFRQNNVTKSLSFRILRYLEYKIDKTDELVPETKLEVLTMLSRSLKKELRYEVSYFPIRGHPLFEAAEKQTPQFMFRLSDTCFGIQDVAANEQIFAVRAALEQLLFIVSGTLCYGTEKKDIQVVKDDWLGEHAMWVNEWTSCGQLGTINHCVMITVNVSMYRTTVQENGDLWALMTAYAKGFFDWLLQLDASKFTDHFRSTDEREAAEVYVTDGLKMIQAAAGVDGEPDSPMATFVRRTSGLFM
jgi:hypothetical protein